MNKTHAKFLLSIDSDEIALWAVVANLCDERVDNRTSHEISNEEHFNLMSYGSTLNQIVTQMTLQLFGRPTDSNAVQQAMFMTHPERDFIISKSKLLQTYDIQTMLETVE